MILAYKYLTKLKARDSNGPLPDSAVYRYATIHGLFGSKGMISGLYSSKICLTFNFKIIQTFQDPLQSDSAKFHPETDVRSRLFLKVWRFFGSQLEKIIDGLVGIVFNQIHHPLKTRLAQILGRRGDQN
jgi:hypothetical protein